MDELGDGIRVEEVAAKSCDGDVVVYKKGAWSKEEDEKLRKAVEEHGIKNWVKIQKVSGLSRPAKNCRLRWLNYLRPNLKKHPVTEEEEKLIFDLHSQYGNSWVRIAAKLPGRSDNEIKNFWHKRVKKCKDGKLRPTSSSPPGKKQKQSHTIIDNHSTNPLPTNLPNHTLPQLSTPNIANNASDAHSPSSLLTSSHPTTPLFPNTPTSRPQSSPNEIIPDNLEAPLACQGSSGASSSLITSLTKSPLILSPPNTLFFRGTSSHSTLPQKWSSPMESPRSPLNLKLSSGVPMQYSTQTTNLAMGSLSGFQLNSPNTTPLSPLKLRLSMPIPSESCLSIPATNFQINSSTAGIPLSRQQMTVGTDHMVPLGSCVTANEHPHSIRFSLAETSGVNSRMHEVGSDNSLEIMKELRKAQARVRFLKKKLNHRNKHVLDYENLGIIESLRSEVPLGENSSESAINDCDLMNSRKRYMLENTARREGDVLQVKKARKEIVENSEIDSEKATNDRNSKLKISPWKSLQRDKDSHGAIITKNLKTFQEQTNENFPVSDAWGNKPCTLQCSASGSLNECSSIGGLLSESSGLWQDSFLKGDLFGQTCPIGDNFPSQRHEPLADQSGIAHGEQPHKEGSLLSYLHTNDFSFLDNGLMDGNMSASETHLFMHQNPISDSLLKSQLCEQNFTQLQLHAASMLDSSYQQHMVQGSLQGVQFFHQTPEIRLLDSRYQVGCGRECPSMEQYCLQMWKPEEPCGEQSLIEGLLADNLWPQSQMVLQDQTFPINQFDSVINPVDEPTSGYAGRGRQEDDNMKNMSEELSSLLAFFPTTLDNGSSEFEFDMGLGLQISRHNSCK